MLKTNVFLLLLLAISITAIAGNEKNLVTASLKSVTVYRMGAEMVHTVKATLVQGNNELIIDGLSNSIDINSIQVGNDGRVTLMSVEFSTDYLRPEIKPAVVIKLEDSIETLNKDLSKLQVVLKTDQELIELLKSNKEIRGTQSGLSVSELVKMMDYYKAKTLELQSEISQLKEKEKRILDILSRLYQQITEEAQKNHKSGGKLFLQLLSPSAGSYNFTVSYITQKAFWNPYYDMRIESVSKPIALSYKAKLVQTTGLDWKNVKLTLATSTPNQNGNAPVFRSWFLGYIDPVYRMQEQLSSNAIQSLGGKVAGVSSNSLDEVVVSGYGAVRMRGNSSVKDVEPLYIVDGIPSTANKVNRIDKNSIKNIEVLKGEEATAIYGSRADGGVILITLKKDLGDHITINENQLNVTFDIDIPYDVPGNGKEQSVSLKELSMPAFYKYYSAPRLDKESYLLGEIADWEKLNLLPGEANIIFEGTFIGKSVIDPLSTMDTLNLTLGKDKRVVVKREKLVDFSSVKFLGSNKKQIFTYEITVKNNKKEKITMLLKDQYPISTNKDIEVELLESNGAANNTEIGVLTWTVNLEPGETKKYRFSYSARYPKDKVVNIN